MRDFDALWKQYQAQDPDSWRYEFRALVNDGEETIDSSEIYSLKKAAGLNTDSFELGNCIAARLDIEIFDEVDALTPPQIITVELPDAEIDEEYSVQLEITGARPFTLTIESGALPDGLTLSSDGIISGVPTASGTFEFTVRADNGILPSALKIFKIKVAEPQPEPVEDFIFIIYGDSYIVGDGGNEDLNYIIDWGDGTQSVVDSFDEAQRTHTYSSEQEWTVTIKNYVSGWIQFNGDSKLRRVLSSFPANVRDNFDYCFSECVYLTDIPEDLFFYIPNVAFFISTFDGCSSLTNIPEKLFANNPNVLRFTNCFSRCTGLTSIPEKIFDNNLKVTYFDYCFSWCAGLTGYAPELWLRTEFHVNGSSCFRDCTGLENYSQIPSNWK